VSATATATNGATATASTQVVVAAPGSPTVSVTVSARPVAGTPTIFTITAAPAPGTSATIQNVQVTFGDGTPPVNLGAVGSATTQHVYAVGTFNASVTATASNGGTATATTQVVVAAPPSPSVSISASANPTTGRATTFTITTATAPGSNATIQNVRVNFGDSTAPADLGAVGSTATTQHVYGAPGTFSVSATATDPLGNTSEFSQRLPLFVFPTSGTPAGGTNLSITGTDFQAGATVTIGGIAAGNVVFNNSNSINATSPLLSAGTVNDLTVSNPDGSEGTLPKAWVADFLDVAFSNTFYSYVTTLVRNAITVGIGGGLYGVNDDTLRQQMAVFLLKGKFGLCYTPPPCTGVFNDVPCSSSFAPWIEALADLGITGGCGGGNYCPQNPVRRDQMAAFLLKTKYGSGYAPPPCTGVFPDVACPSQFADWIEELALEQITGGCGGNNYCPTNPNTRGQMAVFIVKAFNLQ